MSNGKKHLIFLCLLAFVLYANTLPFGYVLDDYLYITGNKFTQQGLAGIADIWTTDVFSGVYDEGLNRYRPLSTTVFAIEYQFFSWLGLLDTLPHFLHFMNILLYALTGILLYRIISSWRLDSNGWTAFVACTLFLAHPLHTEVVANIKSLDEILSLLFALLALYFITGNKKHAGILAPVFLFLAMSAKESAITFLAVIPLVQYYFRDQKIPGIIKTMPGPVIAVAAYLAMRMYFVGFEDKESQTTDVMFNPYLLASTGEKWASVIANAGRYLSLLVWPHPLAFDYSYNQIPYESWSGWRAILSLLVLLGLAFVAVKGLARKTPLSFCIMYYFATFSVASNVVVNTGTPLAERFLYTPSVGFCLALAILAARLLKMNAEKTIALSTKWAVPLSAILIISGILTINRNKAWSDNLTLYETDSQTVPNSALVRMFHGIQLMNRFEKNGERRFIDKAITELTASATINPRFHHAWYNLGQAYQKAGNYDAAIQCYENVLKMHPTHINSHYGMGFSLANGKGEADKALPYLERLVYEFHSQQPDHISGLGIVYGMKGQHQKAIDVLKKGLQYHPQNANLYFNLGITYANMGDQQTAQQYYNKAFELDPGLRK